jgi:hypothetical protein
MRLYNAGIEKLDSQRIFTYEKTKYRIKNWQIAIELQKTNLFNN